MRMSVVSVLGVVAACAGLTVVRIPEEPRPPRNLLLVSLDTLRADRLPAYGFQGYTTPFLDMLAAGGLVVDDAFATAPLTLPSHASLLTGVYPPRLGMTDNAGPPLAPDVTTLAEALSARGLVTGASLASGVLVGRGLDQGFAAYRSGDSNGCGPARRRAEAVVDDAMEWLDLQEDGPFFQWLHFYDTHRPYDLPASARRAHFDPYLAAVQYVDTQLGRMVDYLEARELMDETLIVIVGDHGESLGDHGEESHGIFLYQSALRVPLILHGPGVPAGRLRGPASLVDIVSTVARQFELSLPQLDGIDLLATGVEQALADRDIYAESMYPLRFGWSAQRALFDGRFKLIDGARAELYDLLLDPLEANNLADKRPPVVAAMRRRLETYGSADRAAPNVPADLKERLASLGYVSGSTPPSSAATDSKDPRDHIDTYNAITASQWHQAARRRDACR